ncbi:MAG: SDR family oxidoreductase [bacterium]|nr:SDR family oxidoreductase [bacterium]
MQQVVLITGGSKGIGFALAKKFCQDNHVVLLVARSKSELATAKKTLEQQYRAKVLTLPLDLSVAGSAKQLVKFLTKEKITIDILVNNAGSGDKQAFATADSEKVLSMLQLNVIMLTELTHLLLPGMLKRNRGHIINLASIAGYLPGPNMAVYYASKAYVLSFTRSLAEELRGTAVAVTAVCPGRTKTAFAARAQIDEALFFRGAQSVEQATEEIYRGILAKKTEIIPGFLNKPIPFIVRALPVWLISRLMAKVQR